MTKYELASLKTHPIERFAVTLTATIAANLFCAVLIFLAARWYIHWSIKSGIEDVKTSLKRA